MAPEIGDTAAAILGIRRLEMERRQRWNLANREARDGIKVSQKAGFFETAPLPGSLWSRRGAVRILSEAMPVRIYRDCQGPEPRQQNCAVEARNWAFQPPGGVELARQDHRRIPSGNGFSPGPGASRRRLTATPVAGLPPAAGNQIDRSSLLRPRRLRRRPSGTRRCRARSGGGVPAARFPSGDDRRFGPNQVLRLKPPNRRRPPTTPRLRPAPVSRSGRDPNSSRGTRQPRLRPPQVPARPTGWPDQPRPI